MPNLTHGSLFSGIGGFDLGFERAGIKTLWQVENDPYANKVLDFHWPRRRGYCDIEGIQSIERPDIFTAGFPCQDLSVAGKRAGLAGARSGLFWEIIRIARKVLPRRILIENVPGLLSSNDGRDFGIVQAALGELGYGVAWRVLNSQYFGVPQRRRRVFIIGCLGAVCPGEVLFESEGGGRDIAESEEEGPGVAAPVTTRIGGSGSGWPRYDEDKHLIVYEENTRDEMRVRQSPPTVMNYGGKQKPLIAQTLTGGSAGGRSHGKRSGSDRQTMVVNALQHSGGPDDNDAQAGRLIPTLRENYRNNSNPVTEANMLVAAPLNASGEHRTCPERSKGTVIMTPITASYGKQLDSSDRNGGPPNLIWHNKQQSGEVRECEDISPAVTQQWGTGGNNTVMVGVRRLTPRECERLQGFPDDWTRWDKDGNEICDSARYKLLGNAVTVNVVEWLGRRITEFDLAR